MQNITCTFSLLCHICVKHVQAIKGPCDTQFMGPIRARKWVQSVQSVPNVKRESEKTKPAKVTKEKLSVCVFEKYKKLT